MQEDGYEVVSGPRTTGDGYYESCIIGIEGNQIEITVWQNIFKALKKIIEVNFYLSQILYKIIERETAMILENKLGITDSVELAKAEEKISKKRAIELFESGYLNYLKPGTFKSLAEIHKYLFGPIYGLPDR